MMVPEGFENLALARAERDERAGAGQVNSE